MIGEFIDGPLWVFSLTLFVIGVLWRIFSIIKTGVRPDFSVPRGSAGMGALRAVFSRFVPERTVTSRSRLQLIAGYLFHLGLFALLFFAQPHIDFLAERITGFSWPAMPHWSFIVAAEIAFAGLILLWLHRLLNPVTRLLSDLDDHLGSILVFAVMLTGCLALAQSFEPLRLLHLFLAELLLLYFPFSKLMHTFTFVLSRGYTGATMGRKGIKA
ncbi:MAG: nitrate reductase [Candidatus Thiodiazotropha sp.]